MVNYGKVSPMRVAGTISRIEGAALVPGTSSSLVSQRKNG